MNNDVIYNIIPKSFSSQQLNYRIMNLNDTDTVVNLRNANHVRDNYIYQKPITKEEHIHYYHTKIETGHIIQYVMMTPVNNKVIGCVFLKNIDFDIKTAEYGVFIGDIEELGKGYGTDAITQMTDIAFNLLKLKTLTLKVLSFNEIALRTYKNAGFVEKSRIIDENIESGMIREVIVMELINGRE